MAEDDNNDSGDGNDPLAIPTDEELRTAFQKVATTARSQLQKTQGQFDPKSDENALNKAKRLDSQLEGIVEMLNPFLTPKPESFDDKLKAINAIAVLLGRVKDNTELVDGSVQASFISARDSLNAGEWTGALANTLRDDYLLPMQTHITLNQGSVHLVLHDGLQAMRNIYVTARRDLKKLADNTIDALEDADGMWGEGHLQTMLTVLTAAFSIGSTALAALAPGVGTIASITNTLIATATAAAAERLSKEEKDAQTISLKHDFPLEVLTSFRELVEKIRDQVTTKEEELPKVLVEATGQIAMIYSGGLSQATTGLPKLATMSVQSLLAPTVPEIAVVDEERLPDGLYQQS